MGKVAVQTARIAAVNAKTPMQARPATSAGFRALVRTVAMSGLHGVQPLQGHAHFVQWNWLDGAQ